MILSCQNIEKSFGTNTVLSKVSFHINEHEKMAIVGVNGAGKSTLLKIIMNELLPDDGQVILAKGATIGYLAQHQEFTSELSIYEEMLKVKEPVLKLEERIREIELQMKEASGEALHDLMEEYNRCTHSFEQQNGYACQSEITGVLKGLGFTEEDFSRTAATLSSGQKTRVALGRLLLSSPDIILLDEPTNHLDMESIGWLESYLSNYKGAVMIVAHDRYFLDHVVTKVVELERAHVTVFDGNYTDYAKKKEQLRNAELKQYFNQQQEIKHQQEVIAKLKSFNREKSIKRAESREKMLNKIEVLEKPQTMEHTMFMKLEPAVTSGNDVLTVRGLSKAFDTNVLFEGIDFELKRGERVAIIGGNGTGKTTILKLIMDVLPADAGEIALGTKVLPAYYDQEHQVLHMEKTLFDEIQDTYPDMNNTQVRNLLASFLFTNDDVFKRISDLSGGERARVSLAKLMRSSSNLLILDEPTNHLDIASREILEDALNRYTGTVLYVSHDRYFINRTATRILNLTNHQLLNYIGNYDYYLEKKDVVEAAAFGTTLPQADMKGVLASQGRAETGYLGNGKEKETGNGKNIAVSTQKNASASAPAGSAESKTDWKQYKEAQAAQRKLENQLKKAELEIEALENRNAEIDELLTKEEIYTDVGELMKLNEEKKAVETRLEECMETWEMLSEQLS
jgi:ATP-binding cassette subfamily F protein 3